MSIETEMRKREFDRKLSEREDQSPAEAQLKAEELAKKKARIAQVLSQGVVGHALELQERDTERRYVYVRENDADISRYNALGYRVETGHGEGMHGTGDGKRRVGDTILMSCAKEDYELICEVQQDRNRKKLNSPVKEYKARAEAAAKARQAAPPVDLMERNEE
jgi:hypothetical protein